MSCDSQGQHRTPAHQQRQQRQEAITRLQLLANLLSPTHPLCEADREDLAHLIGQLIEQLHE